MGNVTTYLNHKDFAKWLGPHAAETRDLVKAMGLLIAPGSDPVQRSCSAAGRDKILTDPKKGFRSEVRPGGAASVYISFGTVGGFCIPGGSQEEILSKISKIAS